MTFLGADAAAPKPAFSLSNPDGPPLRWEGEVIRALPSRDGFEGKIIFDGQPRHVQFKLSQSAPNGLDPTPTWRDVSYGPHERQRLDVYLAPGPGPHPVAVYFHGGGWRRGDKNDLRGFSELIAAGISVVAVNYRYCPPENPAPNLPAVSWPLEDGARAVQFIRSRAKEWKLDPRRVGLWGNSAGAFTSLWLATHPDMAQPSSNDPISRESTRVTCVAPVAAQTSLDPEEMRRWVGPELTYGAHAFGVAASSGAPAFAAFLAAREKLLPWIANYSPSALLSSDDPPIFLDYMDLGLTPCEPHDAYYTHSPFFGFGFQKRARALGVECRERYGDVEDDRYSGWKDFLIAHLTGTAASRR